VAAGESEGLRSIVSDAVALPGIASAAIFVLGPASGELVLGAADGVTGTPLEALRAAVREPGHPISRARTEGAAFDVPPMAPGGPALRSHVPIPPDAAPGEAFGVLAVAHEAPTDAPTRAVLVALAASAGRHRDRRT
jgi:hypothetical protein